MRQRHRRHSQFACGMGKHLQVRCGRAVLPVTPSCIVLLVVFLLGEFQRLTNF